MLIMMRILGIDPGMTGGLAFFDGGRSAASGLRWHLMEIECAGEKSQKRVIVAPIRDMIQKLDPQAAYIEAAQAMPKQGLASTARYMRAVGTIEGVITAMNVPIHLVSPRVWKKHYLLKGGDKEKSRALVMRLFPDVASPTITHGVAEAMLIAHFGSWQLTSS